MIRIDAKGIGYKTPIKIIEKTRKVKATFAYQKHILKRSKPQGKTQIDRVVDNYDTQIKSVDEMINYISDMLDFNAKQTKKLSDAPFPEVVKLSDQLVRKMLHYDEGDNSKGKK